MLKRLTKNWSLKLLALTLAFSMWLFVVGQEQAEMGLLVPVELTNVPKKSVVTGNVVTEVKVRVAGPRSLTRQVAEEGLSKTVDLSGMKLGEHVFQVTPKELRLPAGVVVKSISPASFTIILARKAKRKVPVRPVVKGKPAKGFELEEVSFSPEKVTIFGKEEDVKDLDWMWTVPISVKGMKKSKSFAVNLRLPPGLSLQFTPTSVEAKVTIKPQKKDPELKPQATSEVEEKQNKEEKSP